MEDRVDRDNQAPDSRVAILGETDVAKKFLDAFEINEGDTVILVSPPALGNEIPKEVLHRNANLVIVALEDYEIAALRIVLRHECRSSKGHQRVEALDFSNLDIPRAKLVFFPAVLDDPSVVNQGKMIEKACDLTVNYGFIAASFAGNTSETLEKIEQASKEHGYTLEYLGNQYYGDSILAHSWKCTRKDKP